MKPTSPVKKFGIPLLVILAVGALGYFIIGGNNSNKTPREAGLGNSGLRSSVTDTEINTLAPVVTAGDSAAIGGTIAELLRNITSITLPTEILNDPVFSMLSDGTVTLPPRNDPGRRNPFSALSGSGTATSINPTLPTMITPEIKTDTTTNTSSAQNTEIINEILNSSSKAVPTTPQTTQSTVSTVQKSATPKKQN